MNEAELNIIRHISEYSKNFRNFKYVLIFDQRAVNIYFYRIHIN